MRGYVLLIEWSEFLLPYIGCGLQQTYAAIPTKDGIIISCLTNLFRLPKRTHRVLKERQYGIRRLSGAKLRFRASFICNPRVIELFVAVIELSKALFRFAVAIGRNACELVRKRESEQS